MASSAEPLKIQANTSEKNDHDDDDIELQLELKNLADQILDNNPKILPQALETLKRMIETSVTSLSSVPKPLKYLSSYYKRFKQQHELIKDKLLKQQLADIISVLSLGIAIGQDREKHDCLHYCFQGTLKTLNNWGHQYIRQLEYEIIEQWFECNKCWDVLLSLIEKIIEINDFNNDHIQTCDLLMEINQFELLEQYITKENYEIITLYLRNSCKYVDIYEFVKIQDLLFDTFKKFGQYCQALIIAIQMNNTKKVENLFEICTDKCILYQMAFICARHLYQFNLPINNDKIRNILDNTYLNQYYIEFGRDLDVLEPKLPNDLLYKIADSNNNNTNSARDNLATSFINGFINVAFGTDKLLTDNNNNWIYKNKDYGIMSTVASIGLLYLWDIDNGLLNIDKYLYGNNKFVKCGALLAIGIVNCRIRNECDPVLALLNDFIEDTDEDVMISAIFGIGLAYARTNRLDIIDLLLEILKKHKNNFKIFAITSLMCGLISLNYKNNQINDTIIEELKEMNCVEIVKSPFILFAIMGVCLCYYGSKQNIKVPFDEPLKSLFDIMLVMCAYATSGDVVTIQGLLKIIEKPINNDNQLLLKSLAILAIVVVVQSDDIGNEMIQRILSQINNYSNESVLIRKTIPLALSLLSISNPQMNLITILSKYCHDTNDEVSCNGIFSLGIIGAGSNNSRLSKILQQLSLYHKNNRSSLELFMLRFVQGLIYMGKGTVTLNPEHTDRQLLDPLSLIGILIPMLLLIVQPPSFLLTKFHYFLYSLVLSIQPKWLFVLNEDLEQVHVNVRVGQKIDIVGKIGKQKQISGIYQQTTPILLNCNEKAELIKENCEYRTSGGIIDGICVLKKLTN